MPNILWTVPLLLLASSALGNDQAPEPPMTPDAVQALVAPDCQESLRSLQSLSYRCPGSSIATITIYAPFVSAGLRPSGS